jgi:O-methyltransferase involved in polyketide biosynthesis
MITHVREKLSLSGVPETLLWPLHNRAAHARGSDPILVDPRSVALVDAIDYPFERHFGPPSEAHALRALRFDDAARRFLSAHPDGTVVALGDGLETAFWRVDNGRVRWLSVDLPEAMEVRRRLLPEHARLRSLACSALDFRWMDEVDPSRGVFLMAEGLLMYLDPSDVERLLAACAERFRGSEMMFDVIPHWLSQKTTRGGWKKTKHWTTPRMPWGIDVNELPNLRRIHPNIVAVREVDIGRGRSFLFRYLAPLLDVLLPTFIKNKRPAFVVVTFGS